MRSCSGLPPPPNPAARSSRSSGRAKPSASLRLPACALRSSPPPGNWRFASSSAGAHLRAHPCAYRSKGLPMLWVALHFPSLPAENLEHIAAWACQFTPKVSLEPPHEVLLEVEGSLRRFGGIEALLDKLGKGLAATGFHANHAVAPTPRAALWLARSGCRVIAEVLVEAACSV